MIYMTVVVLFAVLTITIYKLIRHIKKLDKKLKINIEKQNIIYEELFFKGICLYDKEIMVFVSDCLGICGGVETRLALYFNALRQQGIKVILVTNANDNVDLAQYAIYYVNFDAKNIQESLEKLLTSFPVKYLEFQFKSEKILKNIQVEKLRKYCPIGFMIHNVIDPQVLRDLPFSHKFAVSDRLCNKYTKYLPQMKVVPNSVPDHPEIYYHNSKMNKALMASRICREKIPTIKAFIEFCIQNKITPHIAGFANNKKDWLGYLTKKYNLSPKSFLGTVSFVSDEKRGISDYLEKNAKEYLFIGGVGQVVLNAGLKGYPVFLTSHLGLKYSTFLTQDNFMEFYKENFTIKEKGIYKASSKQREDDLQSIRQGNIANYNLHNIIQNNFSFKKTFNKYLSEINSCD